MPASPRRPPTSRRRDATTPRRFANDLDRLIGDGCCLCGRGAKAVSVWIPDPASQHSLLVPAGKQRRFVLAFCEGHAATPDASMARAQAIILAEADRAKESPQVN